MKKFDLLIVGGGPAGLTAGLYAVRSGLKVGIITKDIGGTTNSILLLENWPGFDGTGTELMKKFYDQLKEYENVEFIMGDVEDVQKKGDLFFVKTKKEDFESDSLILATGTERKRLNIPGEKEFLGKGVSYCVTCDAFFFKDKMVGVVGGSDCAAISALALAKLAKKVYIIYRGEKLRCEDINSKRLKEKENVEIIYNVTPKEIKGDEKVTKFIGIEKGSEKEIELDGVFIEIGSIPLIKFASNLGLNLTDNGYIVVNENMATSIKGVFAAGDITNQKLKQVVVASGQGSIAAKSVEDYLRNK